MLDNLIWCNETTSTNDLLRRYPDGSCLFTDIQNNGRGRLNRSWLSEEGNLFFSYKLNFEGTESFLPILTGIAVHKAISKLTPSQVFLKWPNDLLDKDGKKLAGILVEQNKNSKIIGIGVNLQRINEEYGFADIQTDRVWLIDLVIQYIHKLEEKSKDKLISYWKENSIFQDQRNIQIQLNGKTISGIFQDISYDGSLLLLEDTTKQTVKFYSGDVLSCRFKH